MTPVRLAVIGSPIAHSLSPAMHRAALRALGRGDVTYEAIEVAPAALAAELARLHAQGYAGLNVTLPHKTAVLPLLADVDDVARRIGAANTLVRAPAGWSATSTDAIGLARSLTEAGVVVAGARAVVLGAGGAARATMIALADAESITVVARRPDAAASVASLHAHAHATTFAAITEALSGATIVVQASSATLGPEADAFARAIPLERCPDATIVDLVYRPRETALLVRASELGLRTVDGLGMLVHQGAASLERWLGVRAPVEAMRAAVDAAGTPR